jgi:hypothetical protein
MTSSREHWLDNPLNAAFLIAAILIAGVLAVWVYFLASAAG